MKRYTKFSSLRDNILSSVKEFLFDENFKTNSKLEEGILNIINLISDYKEEGEVLFPEVIVTNDLGIFDTVSNSQRDQGNIINSQRQSKKDEFADKK